MSAPKAFSLPQLLLTVQKRLDAKCNTDPKGASMRSPAMPTLKLWSKNGMFHGRDLEEAASLVVERVTALPQYYGKPSRSQASPPQKLQAGNSPENDLASKVLAVLEKLDGRISHIENSMKATQLPAGSAAVVPMPVPIPPELKSALDQLDATRRHIMLRFDSEMQFAKQGGPSAGKHFEGASALDIQRVLARISNLEQMLAEHLGRSAT